MKIFIANLSYKLEESKLKKMLMHCGQVASVKLVTNAETGKRKGFGFVDMPVLDQAKAAIAALNEKEVYGRKISLKEAVERQQETQVISSGQGGSIEAREAMLTEK